MKIKLTEVFNQKLKFVNSAKKFSTYRYFGASDNPQEIQSALKNKLQQEKYKHIKLENNDLKSKPILLKYVNAQGEKDFKWLSIKEYNKLCEEFLKTPNDPNAKQLKQEDIAKPVSFERRIEFKNRVLTFMQEYEKDRNFYHDGKITAYIYNPLTDDLAALNAQEIEPLAKSYNKLQNVNSTARELSVANPILLKSRGIYGGSERYEILSIKKYMDLLKEEFHGQDTITTKLFLEIQQGRTRIAAKKNSKIAAESDAEQTEIIDPETFKAPGVSKHRDGILEDIADYSDYINFAKSEVVLRSNVFSKCLIWLFYKLYYFYFFHILGACLYHSMVYTRILRFFARNNKDTFLNFK